MTLQVVRAGRRDVLRQDRRVVLARGSAPPGLLNIRQPAEADPPARGSVAPPRLVRSATTGRDPRTAAGRRITSVAPRKVGLVSLSRHTDTAGKDSGRWPIECHETPIPCQRGDDESASAMEPRMSAMESGRPHGRSAVPWPSTRPARGSPNRSATVATSARTAQSRSFQKRSVPRVTTTRRIGLESHPLRCEAPNNDPAPPSHFRHQRTRALLSGGPWAWTLTLA